ncbi:DivIVA domain-containing protein [bacterium]|nr:DivIVA domain-containing protein [bacterium]
MRLLPIDILEKRFNKKLRGYNPREVDEFLNEVSKSMGEILMENASLKEELEKAKEKLSYFEKMEETLRNAIVLAQKTADEAVVTAHKRAEVILEEANNKAREIIEKAYLEKQEIQREIEELKEKKHSLKAQILGIINTIAQLLEEEEECEKDSQSPSSQSSPS